MNDFEDIEEQTDQSTTGWEPTPLPADHFSLTPEWKRYKAGLSEAEPESAEALSDWRAHAYALAGVSKEEENV